MSGEAPPRKQLRLLSRGTIKVGSLLRRRQKTRAKSQQEDDSDFEHDRPILSHIHDPAISPSATHTTISPSADLLSSNDSRQSQATGSSHNGEEDEDAQPKQKRHRSTLEARKGTLDSSRVNNTRQAVSKEIVGVSALGPNFSSQNIFSQRRLIAKQPLPHNEQSVSFNPLKIDVLKAERLRTTSFITPSTSETLPWSQLGHAASSVFCPADKESATPAEEKLTSHVRGIAIKHVEDKESSQQFKAAKPQPPPKPAPLDQPKTTVNRSVPAPHVDKPEPITKIFDYIPPPVPRPEPGPNLARNCSRNPYIPQHILKNTIPDRDEAIAFSQDAARDEVPPRRTQYGDIPAITMTRPGRISVGSRTNDPSSKTTAISSFPHTTIIPPSQEHTVPANYYTAPHRLTHAYLSSKVHLRDLKRKRPVHPGQPSQDSNPLNPSASPQRTETHGHTSHSEFNIFRNGILLYPELCLLLALALPVRTLINLYSISKDFYVIINQRFLTVILNQATLKAPAAARCYPWRCFRDLTMPDPSLAAHNLRLAHRVKKPTSTDSDGALINTPTTDPFHHPHPPPKTVPTFHWLHLSIHREKVIHSLYQESALRAVPLPGAPTDTSIGSFTRALHKLWFLMDIPDTPRRITYTQNRHLMTTTDLYNLCKFFVKLDMLFNSPVGSEKRDGIKKMVLSACDGLDTLARVLKGDQWRQELDVLRGWTRYGLQLPGDDGTGHERGLGGRWDPLDLSPDEMRASRTCFGIPRAEIGLFKREFWGRADGEFSTTTTTNQRRKDADARDPTGDAFGAAREPGNLIRPDQLIMREVIRRGCSFAKDVHNAVLEGYVDENHPELREMPPRDLNGGRSRLLEREGEYEVDDVVGGIGALSVEDGGDELLDLGRTDKERGRKGVAVRGCERWREEEKARREEEKRMLEKYMRECRERDESSEKWFSADA